MSITYETMTWTRLVLYGEEHNELTHVINWEAWLGKLTLLIMIQYREIVINEEGDGYVLGHEYPKR